MWMTFNDKPCAKQTTIAIIVNGEDYFVGYNDCENPQNTCPRGNLPTGQGYELCKEICYQTGHAEENACKLAGDMAKGSTLYLLGHTYCCEKCKEIMMQYGVREVRIGEIPKCVQGLMLK